MDRDLAQRCRYRNSKYENADAHLRVGDAALDKLNRICFGDAIYQMAVGFGRYTFALRPKFKYRYFEIRPAEFRRRKADVHHAAARRRSDPVGRPERYDLRELKQYKYGVDRTAF